MKLSEKFEEALIYATRAHGNQTRKKTGIPFVAHILGVTAIAFETARMKPKRSARCFMIRWKIAVARNDCAISGRNLAMTSRRIVDGCTDTYDMPKPPWLERKRTYIDHLKNSDASTRLVSASDKLHNTRAILAELRRHGLEVFERFSGKKDGTVSYHRTLVTAFRHTAIIRISSTNSIVL